jgi:purine-cytosine permease-like protein
MAAKFGDRLIEKRSIDYVPIAERHGKVWHLWPVWFSGDAHLVTVATGVVGISLGGNLVWMAMAVVLGAAFGTFFMAFHSTQGPQLGLPQMIQSRPQFGYDLIHLAQRFIAYVLIAALLVFTVAVILKAHLPPAQMALSGFQAVPFLAQFFAAASYQVAWSIYVSDYSRYLPRDVGVSASFWWTFLGAFVLELLRSVVDLVERGGFVEAQPPDAGQAGGDAARRDCGGLRNRSRLIAELRREIRRIPRGVAVSIHAVDRDQPRGFLCGAQGALLGT